MSVRLVEVTRSGIVESIHNGDIVVVNSKGDIQYLVGDPHRLTFFRSTAKPIIAVAVLQGGVAEKFNLDLKEVAIIASSHSGGKEHIEVLKSIMRKTGTDISMLKCGIREPTGKEEARELANEGLKPDELHCNCSGKHLGVIALAKEKGLAQEDYHKIEHTVQRIIEQVVADFCGVSTESMTIGVDGCGVPVYGIPLINMALAYANLCDESFMKGKYRKSQKYVIDSMTTYPEMVAGKGRLDTALMKQYGDRIIGKFGAEGVYCAGLIGKGIGVALKIEDGNSRAVPPVVVETLVRIKALTYDEAERLKEFWRPDVTNNRGEKVGEMKAVWI
ncbi:MAG: asparaginase [Clostridia bacterium]|nr:asparaginase [Clostridia bacterium]